MSDEKWVKLAIVKQLLDVFSIIYLVEEYNFIFY